MAEGPERRILVHLGPSGLEGRDSLLAALAKGGWQAVLLDSLSANALAAQLPAKGLIIVGGSDALGPAIEAIAGGHPELAIVALGPKPLPAARAWLRDRPSAATLDAMLRDWTHAPVTEPDAEPRPGEPRWRRKGDMIIGRSKQTEELLKTLDRLALSPAPVLVSGESGTGKELVARALHYCGPRASERFIALNCAAIPESLFEAELFGHERGAFTGAVAQRPGAFEAANGGTLFLDEIGEMPIAQQAKLLRVLETSEVTRIGSTHAKKVNVRLVAATNRDLGAERDANRFRADLFYRLNVYPVHLRPLRERPEDVLPVADHHLGMIATRDRRPVPRLSAAAAERLRRHRWPGNVRELVNVLERACLIAPNQVIEAEHLAIGGASNEAAPELPTYREAKARFEAEYYEQLMRQAAGNISRAAKLAGKTRKEVYDALRRLEVDPGAFRETA